MTSAAPLSPCDVEFVVTKERREKRAQRESCLKGVQRLYLGIPAWDKAERSEAVISPLS